MAAAFWNGSLSESQVVYSFHVEGILLGLLQAPMLGADKDSAPGKQFTLTLEAANKSGAETADRKAPEPT